MTLSTAHLLGLWLLVLCALFHVGSQQRRTPQRPILKYCTISAHEQAKCQDWARAVTQIFSFEYDIECRRAEGKDQCMQLIEDQQADIVSLDSGEMYIAGRYHSLVPIVYEQYAPNNQTGYFAVAVVKANANTNIHQLKDLRGRKACFSGVGQLAGWILPIVRLLEENLIDIIDCNNIIQNAANFFGMSCAPNALIDKNNPIGTNPQSICALCASGSCAGNDVYAHSEGALHCLASGGDVAFVRHSTVDQLVRTGRYKRQEFALLCPNGGRASIDNYVQCNWGFVPPDAIVISSVALNDKRERVQRFLLQSSRTFSSFLPNPNRDIPPTVQPFSLYSSLRYGSLNLIFSDETTSLAPISEKQQIFRGYFGLFQPQLDMEKLTRQLQKCFVPTAKLCVISQPEMDKCGHMKSAFHTNSLQPEISCVLGENTVDCMRKIQQGQADLTVLDAADIYTASQRYNLEPILAEENNLNDSYYVVAIAKKADPTTDLLYLKGKNSCHSGYKTAAGWVVPMAFLLSNSRVRPYGCNSIQAASEFFSKSCVPGVLAPEYHGGDSVWEYDNLCELCHGNSFRYCSRSTSEPFFGDTGALRCLVEGGGDVAFAKHTTILDNTNGRNSDFWSRNKIDDDFELLCRDGSRSEIKDFAKCNLGQVASNALVTSRYKPFSHRQAYSTLFIYAQRFYGSKYSKPFTFKMFVSGKKYKDLIFQDSTIKLKPIPEARRDHRSYLGHEFLKAMSIVDCTAASASLSASLTVPFLSYLTIYWFLFP